MRPRHSVIALAVPATALGAITLLALESKDVAGLHTRADAGAPRRTRVRVALLQDTSRTAAVRRAAAPPPSGTTGAGAS